MAGSLIEPLIGLLPVFAPGREVGFLRVLTSIRGFDPKPIE
jgi:hypothetical protein